MLADIRTPYMPAEDTAAKLQRGGRLVKYREARMQDWLGSGPESRTLAPRKPKSPSRVGDPRKGGELLMATALRAAGGQVQSHMDRPGKRRVIRGRSDVSVRLCRPDRSAVQRHTCSGPPDHLKARLRLLPCPRRALSAMGSRAD